MSQPAKSTTIPPVVPTSRGQVGIDPYSIPLDEIDVSDFELFTSDTLWGYFERLREEDPIHYCADSMFGPYWSVTRFDDIVYVEKTPEIFSSEPNITIVDPPPEALTKGAGFITMDGPRHDAHRKAPIAKTSRRVATCLSSSRSPGPESQMVCSPMVSPALIA